VLRYVFSSILSGILTANLPLHEIAGPKAILSKPASIIKYFFQISKKKIFQGLKIFFLQ
jgi:hypothetical protein